MNIKKESRHAFICIAFFLPYNNALRTAGGNKYHGYKNI